MEAGKEAPDALAGDECPICYQPMATQIACRTPCAHSLCLACLLRLHPSPSRPIFC